MIAQIVTTDHSLVWREISKADKVRLANSVSDQKELAEVLDSIVKFNTPSRPTSYIAVAAKFDTDNKLASIIFHYTSGDK